MLTQITNQISYLLEMELSKTSGLLIFSFLAYVVYYLTGWFGLAPLIGYELLMDWRTC